MDYPAVPTPRGAEWRAVSLRPGHHTSGSTHVQCTPGAGGDWEGPRAWTVANLRFLGVGRGSTRCVHSAKSPTGHTLLIPHFPTWKFNFNQRANWK